jgi:hypothetical protein
MPDGEVRRSRALAARQQAAGLLEPTFASFQVGQSEPDAIVVGSRLHRPREPLRHEVDGIQVVVDHPELAQRLRGIRHPLDIPVQYALLLVAPTRHEVEPS